MSATDGVVSFLEQVITAAERVMSDTKTPLRNSKWLVQVWECVGYGKGFDDEVRKKLKEKIYIYIQKRLLSLTRPLPKK